jgi:hypothetical protein
MTQREQVDAKHEQTPCRVAFQKFRDEGGVCDEESEMAGMLLCMDVSYWPFFEAGWNARGES